MKICFVSKSIFKTRGGLEGYISRMGSALSRQGHEVHILTAHSGSLDIDGIDKDIHVHKVICRDPFKGSWVIDKYIPILDLLYSYNVKKALDSVIKQYDIDIVQFPDWLNEGFWYSFMKKIPMVIRLHGNPSLSSYYIQRTAKMALRSSLSWLCEKNILRNTDAITSTSYDYASWVARLFHINPNKISVIYNSIDLELFKPIAGPSQEEPVILFVGRLEERKGIGVLYRAIPEILESYPDIRFKFIGRDTLHPNGQYTWREYLRNNFDSCRIIFLDDMPHKELVAHYQRSLFCVFPSLYEMFGNVALEAMACGKSVIVTNVGGFTEFVKDCHNGILVDPNNTRELAKAIKRLINDAVLRQGLGKNARASVEAAFTMERALDTTITFYERVLGQFNKKEINNA